MGIFSSDVFFDVFGANHAPTLPDRSNCLDQWIHDYTLCKREPRFNEHELRHHMEIYRDRQGLFIPLRMNMDRYAARQVGRLPFLRSSNLMDDVLTGRCDTICFESFMNLPMNDEKMYLPQLIVEKAMGII